MTELEAHQVRQGDVVAYRGQTYRVNSIRTRGIASPLFRLDGVGLVSSQLCHTNQSLAREAGTPIQYTDAYHNSRNQ